MIESLIISVVLTVSIEVTLSLLIGLKGEKDIETIIWIKGITLISLAISTKCV